MTTINNTRLSVVGIDLGTSTAIVQAMNKHGSPQVIENDQGKPKTPSVVHVCKVTGEITIGDAALNMLPIDPENVYINFKTDIGKGLVYRKIGDQEITPEYLYEHLLKYLVANASKYYNKSVDQLRAVICVPALYSDKQRTTVRDIAKSIGLTVLGLINEPTAGGISYGVDDSAQDALIAVSDFGGGTYDCSVLKNEGGDIEVLATQGDCSLGGSGVTLGIANLVFKEFKKKHGITVSRESMPAEYYEILEKANRAKEQLSVRTSTELGARINGKLAHITLDRKASTRIAKPLIERISKILDATIKEAKVDKKSIKILPLGGGSRFHALRDLLEKKFGEENIIKGPTSPDLAIAEGAALVAAKLASKLGAKVVDKDGQAIPLPAFSHTDAATISMGIAVQESEDSEALVCSALLHKNTPLPAQSRPKKYRSVNSTQTKFRLVVLQGEDRVSIDDCQILVDKIIDLPSRNSDKPTIEVHLEYDQSQLAQVFVTDLKSQRTENIKINLNK